MRVDVDRCSGFTLVEILIVLILSTLMFTCMAAGLDLGLRAWKQAQRIEMLSSQMSTVQSALLRVIGAAHPEYLAANRIDRRVYFEGFADRLSMVGILPDAIMHNVLANEALFLEPAARNEGGALIFEWSHNLPPAQAGGPVRIKTPLLRPTSSLLFRYWGRADNEASATWHDQWVDQGRLPDLVHVEAKLDNGRLLTVDARILGQTPTDCVYNQVSLTCERP